MNVSVAMATYNGEQYISQQLDSIIRQLKKDDEIIVSDDGSDDGTISIIKSYQQRDDRIKLYKGPRKGYIKNFENALAYCNNEIILLSDQDDIWMPEKRDRVVDAFHHNSNVNVVIHDFLLLQDGEIKKPQAKYSYKKGILQNLLFSSYYGCIMSVRRSFLKDVMPFPENILSHDQWIGIYAETQQSSFYIDIPLILYRRHSQTVSKQATLYNKIRFRILSISSYIANYKRMRDNSRV